MQLPTASIAATLLLFATNALADPNQFCLEIARRGLFDAVNTTFIQGSYAEAKKAYCSSRDKSLSSSTDGSISGSVGPLSANGSSSSAQAAKETEIMCSSDYTSDKLATDYRSNQSILSSNAIKLAALCVPRESNIIDFTGHWVDDDSIASISLKTSKGSQRISRPTYISGSIKCTGDLFDAKARQEINSNYLTMTCERLPESRKQIEPRLVHAGGFVNIFTNAGNFTVLFPKKYQPRNCDPQNIALIEDTDKMVGVKRDAFLSRGAIYKGITDTEISSITPGALRRVMFHFDAASCGTYALEANYASPDRPEQRPMKLYIDGKLRKRDAVGLSNGWKATLTEEFVWFVDTPGSHTVELRSNSPIPHIQSLEITQR
ncbi:exported hypothetical protein [Candidatus Nitrotoga sp. BS]|uniref:hypothetical protein n=1 Tax=Candidatus Nitrotoga sp. BS TaxID=2890408 RepID=UPI001EF3D3A8|nr:hypothetical protein [Candidatus Nitrotoga sp. BS]CAH1197753.1 exported hypothetical protein [Candidatus Nitrotoga sp. BS]